VDNQDGFEGFELLQPTDERTVWLVMTRWRDEESFQAWVTSPAFSHGPPISSRALRRRRATTVGAHSELWSYEIAGRSTTT